MWRVGWDQVTDQSKGKLTPARGPRERAESRCGTRTSRAAPRVVTPTGSSAHHLRPETHTSTCSSTASSETLLLHIVGCCQADPQTEHSSTQSEIEPWPVAVGRQRLWRRWQGLRAGSGSDGDASDSDRVLSCSAYDSTCPHPNTRTVQQHGDVHSD